MREEHRKDWDVDKNREHGQVQDLVGGGVYVIFTIC